MSGTAANRAPHMVEHAVQSMQGGIVAKQDTVLEQTTAKGPAQGDLGREQVPTRLAVTVVAAVHDPGRLGEIAWLPTSGSDEWWIGRQGNAPWSRQRPGEREATGPYPDPYLSRRQTRVWQDGGRICVENHGALHLSLNGLPVQQCTIQPGDLLEIGDRLMLLVTERPVRLDGAHATPSAFGQADRDGWVGESPAAWATRTELAFLARRSIHVLIHGESGTGKELAAEALHAGSSRRRKPWVSRNAATIPPSLADAELFGNLKAYPNPGMVERPGLIGSASGTTLFLDEFGELPVDVQARLLRVLDSGEYTRLGEAEPRRSDFRLIAATNRNIQALKHDVLARFQTRLRLPSLNERREDIPLLAMHLVKKIAKKDPEIAARFAPQDRPQISTRLLRQLLVHSYTTHVRELETLLWASIRASRGNTLEPLAADDPSWTLPPPRVLDGPQVPGRLDPDVIQQALDRHGGRQEPVWRELGLANRYVLARLVKKHNLKVRGR